MKERFIQRLKDAIETYFAYIGDVEGSIIRNYIVAEYKKILEEEFGMSHKETEAIYNEMYWNTYGEKRNYDELYN